MKTKIGTSFGLALLLAVGVIATMLALGMFSASKARADAGAHVHVDSVAASPTTAGATTTVTLQFTTNTVVVAGSGQIVVTFDSTWGIPSSIAKERIALTTQHATGGTSNPAVDPTITTDGSGNHIVTITIDDTSRHWSSGPACLAVRRGRAGGAEAVSYPGLQSAGWHHHAHRRGRNQ